VPQLDAYLEFLAVRSRPNTVLAVAYDLRVFFTVVGKPPARVTPADVLAFVTAQFSGRAAASGRRRWCLGADGAPSVVQRAGSSY
jgi:integrase/recombinase XerD